MSPVSLANPIPARHEPGEAIRRLAAAIALHAAKAQATGPGVQPGPDERKECLPDAGQELARIDQIDSDMTVSLNHDPKPTDLL